MLTQLIGLVLTIGGVDGPSGGGCIPIPQPQPIGEHVLLAQNAGVEEGARRGATEAEAFLNSSSSGTVSGQSSGQGHV